MDDNASELVQSLRRPDAYPDAVDSVQLVETHISYLFLTGAHVYKVKKPVDFGFLDFTTLEKRREYCYIEVELNRRLSPEVYLGVVEVRKHGDEFSFDGPGEVADYAVKMLQLPREREMKRLLQKGLVTEADVQRLAAKIADFHREAETGPQITQQGDWNAVSQNVEENFQQTEKFIGATISEELYGDLRAYSRAFLFQNKTLFDQRAEQGRIKDCHGDLHTAQIFLDNGISIIDCIEFNTRFRYSDTAEDIAFLAMDLDFHQRPDLSRVLIQTYVEKSGDEGVVPLLNFFKSYRAYVRGKVASFRLEEQQISEEEAEEAAETSRAYFNLADSYARMSRRETMFLVIGLTGTGKSTVAQELARRLDLAYISSDVTRKTLAGVPLDVHRYEEFDQGIYSAEFTHRTYRAMLDEAQRRLSAGGSVALDGTYRSADQREAARKLAEDCGVDFWIVECVLPAEEAKRRLDARVEEGASASDGRWEIYQQQRRDWEPVREVSLDRHLILDTGKPLQANIGELLYRFYCGVLA